MQQQIIEVLIGMAEARGKIMITQARLQAFPALVSIEEARAALRRADEELLHAEHQLAKARQTANC